MAEPQYKLEGIVHTQSEVREDFEGPLDVIFLLLSKNKIEIQDVSITAILEQYLAYLDEMKRLDMQIASEFISMASHLMLLKTKMLLSAAEQAEAENELDLLRQSLIERRRKEAMEQIRIAVSQLEPKAGEKNISITLVPTDAEAVFDAKWTEEAVFNLLDNAVKYTPAGGAVRVSASAYQMFSAIHVADNGPGIPEDEQPKVFQRFYRGLSNPTEEGVGIGLYLVRQIAEGQGGYVKVSSKPGEGSTFSLYLPREICQHC